MTEFQKKKNKFIRGNDLSNKVSISKSFFKITDFVERLSEYSKIDKVTFFTDEKPQYKTQVKNNIQTLILPK